MLTNGQEHPRHKALLALPHRLVQPSGVHTVWVGGSLCTVDEVKHGHQVTLRVPPNGSGVHDGMCPSVVLKREYVGTEGLGEWTRGGWSEEGLGHGGCLTQEHKQGQGPCTRSTQHLSCPPLHTYYSQRILRPRPPTTLPPPPLRKILPPQVYLSTKTTTRTSGYCSSNLLMPSNLERTSLWYLTAA